MAYYQDSREQIQTDIQAEEAFADTRKAKHPSKFLQELMGGTDVNADSVSS